VCPSFSCSPLSPVSIFSTKPCTPTNKKIKQLRHIPPSCSYPDSRAKPHWSCCSACRSPPIAPRSSSRLGSRGADLARACGLVKSEREGMESVEKKRSECFPIINTPSSGSIIGKGKSMLIFHPSLPPSLPPSLLPPLAPTACKEVVRHPALLKMVRRGGMRENMNKQLPARPQPRRDLG